MRRLRRHQADGLPESVAKWKLECTADTASIHTSEKDHLVCGKQPWATPTLLEIKTDLIKQQEEETLLQKLNSDEGIKLMNSSLSDHLLKEDKQDFDALGVVEAISAYDFALRGTVQREFGFMAHEIQAVLPYLVTGRKDQVDENGQPVIQRVNYAKLTPVLLKAIQQQQTMILGPQEQINHLKSLLSEEVK